MTNAVHSTESQTRGTAHTNDEVEVGRPRRRRWRRTHIALLICGVLAVVAALVLRSPSPVGHWDSAAGQDRFLTAYAEAFADLPEAEQSLDVRTDFGIVRLYRFAGTGAAGAPLVLLPGVPRPRQCGPTICRRCWRSAMSTPSTCSASQG